MKRSFTHWLKTASLILVLGLTISPIAPVRASDDEASSETTSSFDVWGQLIELSSTEAPTTIVIRENPAGEFTDFTVDIDTDTVFGTNPMNTSVMSDWITGDTLHVKGTKNENTGVVTADVIVNGSLNPEKYHGLNGWITAVDTDDSTMTVQWEGVEHVVNVTSNTHMVVPPVNPAALTDFQISDRVRLRLIEDSDVENEARIIVALRRGDEIFLKARTRGFGAELTDLDDNGDGTGSLSVTLTENPHLRADDVNNLVGEAGDELVITYDEHTNFVRKFNGEATVDEFVPGDALFIVGRVNDDGTIEARLVKDTSMWRRNVAQRAGEISSIDTSANTLTLEPLGNSPKFEGGVDITVTYSDSTEFVERGEESVTEDDLEVGDVVRVFGTARLGESGLEISDVSKIWLANPLKVEDGDVSDEDEDEEESEDEDEDSDEDADEDEDEDSDEDEDEDESDDTDAEEAEEDDEEELDEDEEEGVEETDETEDADDESDDTEDPEEETDSETDSDVDDSEEDIDGTEEGEEEAIT